MKERPILFSTEMVRAILAGRKTQTRRVVKGSDGYDWMMGPWRHADGSYIAPEEWRFGDRGGPKHDPDNFPVSLRARPLCLPGDRLWVRETWSWAQFENRGELTTRTVYRADFPDDYDGFGIRRWFPSIHMRRADSRLLLDVTDVRVERLTDISAADAVAEGVVDPSHKWDGNPTYPRARFRDLWNRINGADAWDANPWVWVVSFRRAEPAAEAA